MPSPAHLRQPPPVQTGTPAMPQPLFPPAPAPGPGCCRVFILTPRLPRPLSGAFLSHEPFSCVTLPLLSVPTRARALTLPPASPAQGVATCVAPARNSAAVLAPAPAPAPPCPAAPCVTLSAIPSPILWDGDDAIFFVCAPGAQTKKMGRTQFFSATKKNVSSYTCPPLSSFPPRAQLCIRYCSNKQQPPLFPPKRTSLY
jgi:hypothetical protein